MSQLTIFDNNYRIKSSELLESLNEGRKDKFLESPIESRYEDKIIIGVINSKTGDRMYNVILQDGSFPKDFSINWRCWSHIRQELGEQCLTK